MKIIGIDQSITHTAIVVLDEHTRELIDFTVIKTILKNKEGSEEFSFTQRIKNSRDASNEFIEKYYDTRLCAIEGLSLSRNSKTARPLAGLFYALTIMIDEKEIPFDVIAPKSAKKTAGNGNASKEEVFAALPENVAERFIEAGYKKTTGLMDLSDAYFIALTALNKIHI